MTTTFEIKVDNIDKVKSEMRQQAVKALEECGFLKTQPKMVYSST